MSENADDDEDLMELRRQAASMSTSVSTHVVSSPAKLLDDIVGFVSHGRPIPSDQLSKLDVFLQTFQARIDLARIGVNDFQLNQLTRVAKMLDTVANNLFTELNGELLLTAQLTPDEVIGLFKVLLAEKNALVGHLTGKNQQQLVSSTDNMRQLPQHNSSSTPSDDTMNADERKGVRDLLEALLSSRKNAGAIEATVVAEPAAAGG